MSLSPLLRPRSIAIVGASERSLAISIMRSLDRLGFDGKVYPVNPRATEVAGRRCYASLAEIDEAPDVVALAVGRDRILDIMRQLPDRKARSAVIYEGGFAELGEEGRKIQSEITGICREAGIALCGPNCLGIVTPHNRSSTFLDEVANPAQLGGNVGLISHSGSVAIGMMVDVRRFGFSSVVSAGNEAVCSTADYLEYFIDDPQTKVIAAFTETIRDPGRFVAALDRAADAGKPVVVLKVGKSERAQRSISTHTAGLAGDARVFSEVLRAHRAIEVDDLEGMTEVLAVFQGRHVPKGGRTAVITASGGQAELLLDLASEKGVQLPPLSTQGRAEAEEILGPVTGDGNPLDAWGKGNFNDRLSDLVALLQRGEFDNIVFCKDTIDKQPYARFLNSVKLVAAAAETSDKPHFVLNPRTGLVSEEIVEICYAAGAGVLSGAQTGLVAIHKAALSQRAAPARPQRQNIRRSAVLEAAGGRSTIH
ncbi:MAG: CoA-binding protein, partial [Pseudorhodoplanes sp.]